MSVVGDNSPRKPGTRLVVIPVIRGSESRPVALLGAGRTQQVIVTLAHYSAIIASDKGHSRHSENIPHTKAKQGREVPQGLHEQGILKDVFAGGKAVPW